MGREAQIAGTQTGRGKCPGGSVPPRGESVPTGEKCPHGGEKCLGAEMSGANVRYEKVLGELFRWGRNIRI